MRALVVAALAASSAASGAAARAAACDPSAFNISLAGKQCFGLSNVGGVPTSAACLAAACTAGAQMFQFCLAGSTCTGYTGPSCWVGAANLSDCVAAAAWGGAARVLPPPAPLLPQAFVTPCPGSAVLSSMDLGSSAPGGAGAWTLSLDGAPPRAILVPAGGYNSDEQAAPLLDGFNAVEGAVYTRTVTLPSPPPPPGGATTWLDFGAVNYGAEVYLSALPFAAGNPVAVGVHHGPLMPFSVDVTRALLPGVTAYNLTVIARPFAFFRGAIASGFRYEETWAHPPGGFSARFPNGISKSVALVTRPPLRVTALHLRASVANLTLRVNVSLQNDGGEDFTGSLGGTLAPAPGSPPFPYPPIPPSPLSLPALGGTAVVTFTLPWAAGPDSFWWPNRPFAEDYAPVLHLLTLAATPTGGGAAATSVTRRFGFVEHAEGPTYYTVNGVRINQLSDATPEAGMSFYDAYASPAFQHAPGGNASAGAAETWRRYMRVGMTSNRIHQSTPSEGMMAAADEVGFLLKPETPVRGCPGYEPCNASSALLRQAVAELVAATSGHPSTLAFSVENESGDGGSLLGDLIDAAATSPHYTGVPLTTEGSGGAAAYNGTASGARAVNMLHYAVPPPSSGPGDIRGVGECAWCVEAGMETFSSLALAGRLADVAYYAGWDWINYWSNFLEVRALRVCGCVCGWRGGGGRRGEAAAGRRGAAAGRRVAAGGGGGKGHRLASPAPAAGRHLPRVSPATLIPPPLRRA
jgi:hypothetical protein